MRRTTKPSAEAAAQQRTGSTPQRNKKNLSSDPDFPSFPEYYDPEFPTPRIMPVSDENYYRSFFQRSLPPIKAPKSLRDRIKHAIEHSDTAE